MLLNKLKQLPPGVILAILLIIISLFSLNYYYIPSLQVTGAAAESEFDAGHLIECSKYGKKNLPIYSVDTSEKKIALTFDAAWGNEDTSQILDILDKHQVKVTFFMTGGWVESFPEDVKTIAARGHELGNHSQNHKYMSKLSGSDKESELMSVHKAVKELTGIDMHVFRPPYGDYNNDVVKTAFECGYYTIQWDVDSLDWKDYGAASIVKTICKHKALDCGSIILCHNGAKYTASALDEVITTLKGQGYEFVTVSELIYKDNFKMNVDGSQSPVTE